MSKSSRYMDVHFAAIYGLGGVEVDSAPPTEPHRRVLVYLAAALFFCFRKEFLEPFYYKTYIGGQNI